jgi:hypothetical protein
MGNFRQRLAQAQAEAVALAPAQPPAPQTVDMDQIDLEYVLDADDASPISLAYPWEGKMKVRVIGGLKKDELLAAPIAAILSLRRHSASIEAVCDEALAMADVLLARAAARRLGRLQAAAAEQTAIETVS